MTPEEKKHKALEELAKFGELQREAEAAYEKDCDDWWDNLSYDDKLKAFFSVTKRIYQGDVKEHGSYRYVLYDVFGFEPDAYGVGMQSGYMSIHNAIFDGVEFGEDEENV